MRGEANLRGANPFSRGKEDRGTWLKQSAEVAPNRVVSGGVGGESRRGAVALGRSGGKARGRRALRGASPVGLDGGNCVYAARTDSKRRTEWTTSRSQWDPTRVGRRYSPVESASARAKHAGWIGATRASSGCTGVSQEARAGVGRWRGRGVQELTDRSGQLEGWLGGGQQGTEAVTRWWSTRGRGGRGLGDSWRGRLGPPENVTAHALRVISVIHRGRRTGAGRGKGVVALTWCWDGNSKGNAKGTPWSGRRSRRRWGLKRG